MGAFYLSPGKKGISEDVLNLFTQKGFSDPVKFVCHGFEGLFYPKQCVRSINNINLSGTSVYISGSCFVRGNSYEQGLKTLLEEYINNEFCSEDLSGNYFLLFRTENGMEFYSDPTGGQNIFFHKESGIISSSFLACITGAFSVSGRLHINKKACTEILLTGNLIGPDTIVEEISRYEPAIQNDLPGIKRIPAESPEHDRKGDLSFREEVDYQLQVLNDFFKGLKPVMDELGVLSGLTGGFDSRLLFLTFRNHTDNYSLYSTSRPKPTVEFKCAKKLADMYGRDLVSPNHRAYDKMDTDQFIGLMTENLYFNDGQIRTNQLWTEEIKSKHYLESLYKDRKLGMSGIGGEQYRNGEYLIKDNYQFNDWFFYEMIYRQCRDPFLYPQSKNLFLDHIREKIYALLDIKGDTDKISGKDIKRYYNEVYNQANRVVRNNIENQLHYFVSPFTGYSVSRSAYKAIPLLGAHHQFEKEMIRTLAPETANVELDYGYSTDNRVPLKFRAIPHIKRILGFRNYFTLYNSGKKDGNLYRDMIKTHPELEKFVLRTEKLNLPVSVEKIKQSNHLSPLLIEIGLFLHMMADNIIDD